MRSLKGEGSLVVKGIAVALLAVAGTAFADAPASKWYDAIGLSGYVQGSYVGNLNKPATRANAARVFDVESNSFNLNAFHLQVAKPMGDDGYGFTTKLHTGRDARIIKSAGTGGAADFDVQEAFLTVATPGLKALTFTGGKFVTLEGLEVIESPSNPNFSEGLLFGFAEPFTHTGLKTNYAFNDKVNATFGVVNGWDTAADANDGKTLLWQVATAPVKNVTWSVQGTYGPEASTDNQSKRTSWDTLLGVTATDKLSLWLQGNWGQDTHVTRTGGATAADNVAAYPVAVGPSTVRWSGVGIWAQYVVNGRLTEALRFETFNDQGGANRLGTGLNNTMKEITWTNKFQVAKNVFTRLEYRHDWSNQGVFSLKDGTAGTNQNTFSADWVVTF